MGGYFQGLKIKDGFESSDDIVGLYFCDIV